MEGFYGQFGACWHVQRATGRSMIEVLRYYHACLLKRIDVYIRAQDPSSIRLGTGHTGSYRVTQCKARLRVLMVFSMNKCNGH